MTKKLVALISTEGKTAEQIKAQAGAAWQNYLNAEQDNSNEQGKPE